MGEDIKTCTKCGATKPSSEFYAGRGVCKDCIRAQSRAYHHANRDKANARSRAWQAANQDRRRLSKAAYYQANRERIDAAGRAWREANPEKYAEYRRRSYAKHKERRLAEVAAWREANPEKVARINREWASRRRAMEAAVQTSPFTISELEQRFAYYGHKCWICRSAPGIEIDHVKPISKGGSHMLSNIRPACRACNASKNAKWPFVA